MLEKQYKFYLSFENSFCKDYVTEKFFKILNLNMIPVVLGGSDYTKIAPNKSYINAKDFENIEDLASYLKYLDQNLTAYVEYFEWKNYFQVRTDFATPMCDLCKALNDPSAPEKSYDDIFKWWRTDGSCQNKGEFSWSKNNYEDTFKDQVASFFEKISSEGLNML